MTIFYIIFAIVFVCILLLRVQKKVKKQQQATFNLLQAQGITFNLVTQGNLSAMGIDERNQLLVIIMTGLTNANIMDTQTGTLKIRFSEICDVLILKDEEVFNETSLSRGVFSGSIKQKHVHDIEGVSLKIVTNNIANPEVIYSFKDIKPVAKAVEEAEKWYRAIRIIIERKGAASTNQVNNAMSDAPLGHDHLTPAYSENNLSMTSTLQPVNKVNSVSEELVKLHELKEKNIITQQEFEQMKKRILN